MAAMVGCVPVPVHPFGKNQLYEIGGGTAEAENTPTAPSQIVEGPVAVTVDATEYGENRCAELVAVHSV